MRRNNYSFALTVLVAVYVVSLVVANIIAGKMVTFPFGMVLTAGVFCFPIVYIIGDVVPEVYGLSAARKIIWVGFAANALAVVIFMVTLAWPYPPFWEGQSAFANVLGFTPRLLIASFCGYLVGTNVNAYVLIAVKKLTSGRLLWVRTISSTIVGETIDSSIFMTVAFLGVMPLETLPVLVFGQTVVKVVYETVATPVTYAVVSWFKRLEGVTPEAELRALA